MNVFTIRYRSRATIVAMVAWLSATSLALGQCGRAGSTSFGQSAMRSSAFAAQLPLASANGSLSTFALQNRIAQQNIALAQQQRYLQAMAAQRALQQQTVLQQQQALGQSAEANASPIADARRKRLLETNAQRIYRLAIAAESNRQYAAAAQHYRRIVRLLGPDARLSEQAKSSLALLEDRRQAPVILTAMSEPR